MKKKCDICGKSDATMKVRQMNKDGRVVDLDVCAACAQRRGFADAEKVKANVAEVMADIKHSVADGDAKLVCPGCTMTFAEFKRQGRLGCAQCYETFSVKLEPLIRRIQGATRHVGKTVRAGRKRARSRMQVEGLRAELQTAIQAEDYEKAATLRDQLGRAEKDAGG